jgi:hypothetical protein
MLAQQHDREIIRLPTVTLLRARFPAYRHERQTTTARLYGISRRPISRCTVSPARLEQPWQSLAITAHEVTLRALAEACGKAGGLSLQVDGELAARRCSVFAPSVTVGDLAVLFAALGGATPTIQVRRTPEQRTAEEKGWNEFWSEIPKDRLMAAELEPEIVATLSQDQKRALQAGTEVEVQPQTLPAALRQRVEEYMQLSMEALKRGTQGRGPQPDLDRFSEFSLQIMPGPKPHLMIFGWAQDGKRLGF